MTDLLAHSLRLLQVSLDYVEENVDIKPHEINVAEISLAPIGTYQGSVFFPSWDIETFVSHWGDTPVVYWMNDYKSEGEA